MKTIIIYLVIAILAILAGIGSGHLYHNYEVNNTNESFYSKQWTVSEASTLSSKAVVAQPSFDFGAIDQSKQYRHEFLIESKGTRDLEIWFEGDDLGPLSFELTSEKIKIERGTTIPLTVNFDGKDIQEDFEKQLEIKTNQNDGKSFFLKVSGQIPGN